MDVRFTKHIWLVRILGSTDEEKASIAEHLKLDYMETWWTCAGMPRNIKDIH